MINNTERIYKIDALNVTSLFGKQSSMKSRDYPSRKQLFDKIKILYPNDAKPIAAYVKKVATVPGMDEIYTYQSETLKQLYGVNDEKKLEESTGVDQRAGEFYIFVTYDNDDINRVVSFDIFLGKPFEVDLNNTKAKSISPYLTSN
jgi:hypothetical protein